MRGGITNTLFAVDWGSGDGTAAGDRALVRFFGGSYHYNPHRS